MHCITVNNVFVMNLTQEVMKTKWCAFNTLCIYTEVCCQVFFLFGKELKYNFKTCINLLEFTGVNSDYSQSIS